MFKYLLKYSLYLYLLIAIGLCAWFAREYFFDAKPNPERVAFYAGSDRQIPDKTNLAVAVSGLNAPANEDIFVYGRQVVDSAYGGGKAIQGMPKRLAFIELDKKDEVDCAQSDAVTYIFERCTTPQQAETLISKNSLLLTRYFDFYHMPDWQGIDTSDIEKMFGASALLSMQSDLLVNESKPEQAFALWKNNHEFILRTLSLEIGASGQQTFQFLYLISLNTLEQLLYKVPETVLAHQSELDKLLMLNGMANYNLKGMLRADYHQWNSFLVLSDPNKAMHIEYMRNRMYDLHQDYLKLSKIPIKAFSQHFDQLSDKYNYPPNNKILTAIRAQFPRGAYDHVFNVLVLSTAELLLKSLFEEMHTNNAKLRLLNIAINKRQQHVAPTQSFLDQLGKEYDCPFTEKPMVLDEVKKTIYCENPATKERVAEVRLPSL